MILCLAYVVDDGLKAFLVVDIECASTLSPPFLANRRGRGIMCGEWTETFLLQRLEPAGAPGFELLPNLLRFAVARHDDVHMVRAAIDGVESPPPHPARSAMVNSTSRRWSWSRRQASSVRRACASRLRAGSGSCQPWRYSTHPRSSPGSQVPYVGQVRKEAKGSGKGGSQSRLLVLLIRESAPGPSMSPLIMSHINRTRPRQGLELVIRRVAGSQISHIFRRASAGSEALPSLARRVSMQQHAELPCRGNNDSRHRFRFDHVRPAFRFHQGDTSSSPSRTSRNSGPETATLTEPLCVASFTRSLIEPILCGVAR